MKKQNSMIVQLGMTPRYLDLYCHEALYEIDVGVNEVRDRLDGEVAREEGAGIREVQTNRTCASPQTSLPHR